MRLQSVTEITAPAIGRYHTSSTCPDLPFVSLPRSIGSVLLLVAAACRRYELSTPHCPTDPPPDRSTASWQPSTRPRRIEGYVLDFETRAPRPNAVVTASPLARQSWSDSAGYFRLDSIPPGRYELVTRHPAYHARHDTVMVALGAGVMGRISLDARRVMLDGCGYVQVSRRRPWWKLW
jgi:hypothetical protein